ncbi:Protein pxr1 [Penicillium manginii]|uniref:Protein pxr1 n=1 Tax=Penicillium manginii TaxID=203109 RepID=UPI00254961CC|nr:Protein pxr1 [Penicillium manginii]KAJ5739678.1 Protein pxr1 [Penicillium manginii]
MGLAAAKRRTKISNDPNNTQWARSTSGFGHKIMSSQGWAPGGRLGAKDAAHADLLTSASTSHIKVTIKDDTLGLGARLGREGEPTGLDAFKGLLGRLNGKSEEEQQVDQRKREDVKLARYVALKFPEVRFVRGGLLAQEKEAVLADAERAELKEEKAKKEKSKKRERSGFQRRQRIQSKDKSSKKDRSRSTDVDSSSESKKKEKKKSKKRKADSDESESEASDKPAPTPAVSRERLPMARQIFRGRHIAQKKRALMDDKSLNEIFMVKA